jgi:3'-5' exoribonuclease
MKVREFADGIEIAGPLMIREVRVLSDGLQLTLADRTGAVAALVGDDSAGVCRVGVVVWVSAKCAMHERFGPLLEVQSIRAAAREEYRDEDLFDGPSRSPEQMESDLRELVSTIQNPHLRRLLGEAFGENSATWQSYRDAPAAKRYHQAYRHGLLEHCLTVAQAVSAISATFPGIDRDIAVTGALLHDIGKLEAYDVNGDAISMSDRGRLYGEIPLGYYRVRRMIERLDGFPGRLEQAVLHIILSHHGALEHGSPVVPCTREATLVHMIDNLGASLGSFDRLEKQLPAGEQWSRFDKALGAGAYFAARGEQEREAA